MLQILFGFTSVFMSNCVSLRSEHSSFLELVGDLLVANILSIFIDEQKLSVKS